MKINEDLVKLLNKEYKPSSLVHLKFKEKEIAIKTDKNGNAILAFVGRKNENGNIKGERYARTFKYDKDGKIIKDHWELKGKAT
jgi:hypothetical protein